MPNVIVLRGLGDKEGEPIIEPLATSANALKERGRREIDYRSLDAQELTIEVPYSPLYQLGDLILIHETYRGYRFIGKITGVEAVVEQAAQMVIIQLRGYDYE